MSGTIGDLCRKHCRIGLAALAATTLVGLPEVASAQEPQLVRIGIPSPLNTILAFWMADEAGFYKAQGIRVEFKSTEGGSRGAAMIQSGEIQVMQVGMSSVLEINRTGGDIRTIGSLSNVNRFILFGAPGVKNAADLKGGAIAISSNGSETDTTATIMLERLGLKRADVQVREFGGAPSRLAALNSGAAKASPLNEPSATLAREQGLPVLVDLAADQFPWLFSSIVVKTSYLKENRALLLRFMKATIEGNYLAVNDEKRGKEVLARELKLKEPKVIDIIYNDFKAGTPVTTEPTPQSIANILKYSGANTGKVSDYVDASLLDELKKSGFLDEMARKYAKK